ncbi:dihydrodipicolinate synthase family protein [Aliiroseovarius sp. PrR006]|uniref:dihydrodipicolinate synthase family protein n=1 Tax=Aliiroseovarius sp. PrR006 TaxID=2706883 RepID=UPI0013CFB77B|nr:dihydrodipicolinate synthase family protein [Aliiroseovarius sp. PrR006]NDW54275.1 N-acetylneuraminate lyase [Aliiroseovarius sp. PrR006]
MAKSLSGMYAALLTGFSDDGAFDPSRQIAITDYVLRQGLDGIYIGGSSGESGLMSTDELLEQQRVIAELPSAQQSRVIAHVGQPNLRDSIALAKQAKALGFEALSALPPHSYPFSDEEIYQYYVGLAAATDLPLIVYEVPIRTGRPLPVELLVRILDIPNVAGLKFTSTDLFKLSMLQRSRPDKIFFFGFDEVFTGAAAMGCDGGIGTTYNVLGRLYTQLNKSVQASDLETAQQLQQTSQKFVEVLLETGVMPGVKAALRSLGVDAGYARAPLVEKVSDAEERLSAFLSGPEVRPWLVDA